jgi:hypothetical protein
MAAQMTAEYYSCDGTGDLHNTVREAVEAYLKKLAPANWPETLTVRGYVEADSDCELGQEFAHEPGMMAVYHDEDFDVEVNVEDWAKGPQLLRQVHIWWQGKRLRSSWEKQCLALYSLNRQVPCDN